MKAIRKLRMTLNRWRGAASVSGIRLPVDSSVLSPNMQRVLAKGQYEAKEAIAAAKLVAPGDRVLELGAGLGFLSSYLRRFTDAGPIACVEASPSLIPVIEQTHRINGVDDVVILHGIVQVSPQAPSVPFYCRKDFWASSLDAREAGVEAIVEVATMSFTDLLDRFSPDVLIADIEGAERELFGLSTLGKVSKILLELHPQVYGYDGLHEIFGEIGRLGFAYDSEISHGTIVAFRRR